MDIVIRQMREGEGKEIQRVGQRAFSGMEGWWVPKPKAALVAEVDGVIAGAVIYKVLKAVKKIGYLDYGFVDPKFHGSGIGNALYREATQLLWKEGCDVLTAAVKDDNAASFSLLEKNGYSRVSLIEMVKTIGVPGTLSLYFGTLVSLAVGMNIYMALKEIRVKEKQSSTGEMGTYLFVNLLILCFGMLVRSSGIRLTYAAAYMIFLLGGVAAGGIGVLMSKRKWRFGFTNGGFLVCLLISLGSGAFPMFGNWYPRIYEDTSELRRDMGRGALIKWIYTLAAALLYVVAPELPIAREISQLGGIFLIYHVIALYPFESLGGRRVYLWNKWIYVAMSLVSAGVFILLSNIAG